MLTKITVAYYQNNIISIYIYVYVIIIIIYFTRLPLVICYRLITDATM